jgi:NAD(P)-dependent dehydrogenase (short-subunit alcohol dehydrogenase family)
MSARNKRLSCITKRPVIVNLTSLSGWFTAGKQPDYAYPTSKACLNMLTKSLSIDLAPEGIRVVGMMPEVGQSIPFIAEKMVQTIFNLFNREVSCTEGNIFFNYDGVSIAW